MALDGLEAMLKARFKYHKLNVIRFADDFVVTGTSKEFLREEVRPLIENFLSQRGLELSKEKTKITSIQEGFDFLGQNIRKYGDKLLIKPSAKSIKSLLSRIKKILKENKMIKTCHLIEEMNPILRGWANYHRHVVSKQIFSYIDNAILQKVWSWCRRRHPGKKSIQWIKKRYFRTVGDRNWVFAAKTEQGKWLHLFNLSSLPIKRHVKIRGDTNPYDPRCETYLEQRLLQKWKDGKCGTGRLRYLWLRQIGKCPRCDGMITKDTGWHTHHIIYRTNGGKDTLDNLVLLHPTCHHQLHTSEHREYHRILTDKNFKGA